MMADMETAAGAGDKVEVMAVEAVDIVAAEVVIVEADLEEEEEATEVADGNALWTPQLLSIMFRRYALEPGVECRIGDWLSGMALDLTLMIPHFCDTTSWLTNLP